MARYTCPIRGTITDQRPHALGGAWLIPMIEAPGTTMTFYTPSVATLVCTFVTEEHQPHYLIWHGDGGCGIAVQGGGYANSWEWTHDPRGQGA